MNEPITNIEVECPLCRAQIGEPCFDPVTKDPYPEPKRGHAMRAIRADYDRARAEADRD